MNVPFEAQQSLSDWCRGPPIRITIRHYFVHLHTAYDTIRYDTIRLAAYQNL